MSIIAHLQTNDALDYIKSEDRTSYRSTRSENGASVFLSGNMTEEENVNKIIDELSSFGVTKEKYDSFAWTVALAPADDPQIAVAVMLVQGKTSSNAAPIAREIIGKYGEDKGWEK